MAGAPRAPARESGGGGRRRPGPRRSGPRRFSPGRALRLAARLVLIALLVLVVGAILAVALLRGTNPSPRDAAGWSSAAPLPEPRGEGTGAVIETDGGPRLAVAGGLHGVASTSDEVALYDPVEDRWTEAPPLPEPRHHTAAAAIGDTLYVSGGSPAATDLAAPTTQLWALGDGADGWSSLRPLLAPRWGHRMVAVDGRLFAIGGQPGARVQIYDPDEDDWSFGAAIPRTRDHLGAVVLDDEIWTLGGRDADDTLTDRVDVYDPDRDEWRTGPSLPAPVSAAAVGVVDGRVHVIDGEDPATLDGGVIDEHWVLDPAEGTWKAGPASRLPVHGAADGVIDGRLYVAGGASRQGALSTLSWTDEVQVLIDPDG